MRLYRGWQKAITIVSILSAGASPQLPHSEGRVAVGLIADTLQQYETKTLATGIDPRLVPLLKELRGHSDHTSVPSLEKLTYLRLLCMQPGDAAAVQWGELPDTAHVQKYLAVCAVVAIPGIGQCARVIPTAHCDSPAAVVHSDRAAFEDSLAESMRRFTEHHALTSSVGRDNQSQCMCGEQRGRIYISVADPRQSGEPMTNAIARAIDTQLANDVAYKTACHPLL